MNDILCQRFEDSNTGRCHLQQVVPTTLRPKTFESIPSSATAVHLGFTGNLEKLRTRFYWPGHKKDVSVFVSSCLDCQIVNNVTAPSKIIETVASNGLPFSPLPTLISTLLDHFLSRFCDF